MQANKIKYVTDKILSLIPEDDKYKNTFKNLMESYIKMIKDGKVNLPSPNSGNTDVDTLISKILNGLLNENIDHQSDPSGRKYGGYSYYWYQPYYWGYWNNAWYPYYWWGYGGYNYYVGGSKKTNVLGSMLDGVDIHNFSMTCDSDRLCNITAQFTKGPIHVQDTEEEEEFDIV